MLQAVQSGKLLTRPLPPLCVQFPLALFVLSLLFDLSTWFVEPSNALVRGACWTMALGVLTALAVAGCELAGWLALPTDHPARRLGGMHLLLTLAAIALYAVNALFRLESLHAAETLGLPLACSLVGIGMLSAAGYLRGKLVYAYGLGVGPYQRSAEVLRRTYRPEPPAADRWVYVTDADDLSDGQTLRVEVEGLSVAVVKLEGRFCAVQEFGTHQHDLLLEGGTYFDLRRGEAAQVSDGVGLETLEVSVRDGQVRVRVPRRVQPHAVQTA